MFHTLPQLIAGDGREEGMAAVVRDKKDTAAEDGARVSDSCLATSLILAIIASVKSGRER